MVILSGFIMKEMIFIRDIISYPLVLILFLCTEETDGIVQLLMQKIVREVDTLWLPVFYEKDGLG